MRRKSRISARRRCGSPLLEQKSLEDKHSLRAVVVPILAKAAVRTVVSVDDFAIGIPLWLEVGNLQRADVDEEKDHKNHRSKTGRLKFPHRERQERSLSTGPPLFYLFSMVEVEVRVRLFPAKLQLSLYNKQE